MKRTYIFIITAIIAAMGALVACHENTEKSPETKGIDTTGNHTPTEGQSSTENSENKQGEDADEIRVLTLEKALHTYYE